MAESTRSMRKAIFDRDILPTWKNRLLSEITPDDLRGLCAKVKERGAPRPRSMFATSSSRSTATRSCMARRCEPGRRSGAGINRHLLAEGSRAFAVGIRILFDQIEHVATLPTIRLGLRLILLTMVRKSELLDATWDEVDFENAVWTIPKERMKRSRAHNVYLARQALDIMVALKTCAGNSPYVLPSRYESDQPMSRATFNRVIYAVCRACEDQRAAVGRLHGARPAAHWRDVAERARLQQRLDREKPCP